MPNKNKTPGSALVCIGMAAAFGSGSALYATLFTSIVVEAMLGSGTVSFEMGVLLALFLSAVGGLFVGALGAVLGIAGRAIQGLKGWLVSVIVASAIGTVIALAFYSALIVPRATVPEVHVFWVGVVTIAGVAVAGGVGGAIGRWAPSTRM